jgi:polysaccharide pyruvyl transferase WcaK-like protein
MLSLRESDEAPYMTAEKAGNWIDWANDSYTEFLKTRRDKLFHVYPYGGHSGDVFIRMGSAEMLSDLGIRTTVDPLRADVILWAGGYLTMWADNLKTLAALLDRNTRAECIVGPTTFNDLGEDWKPVIAARADRISALYARDKTSHEHLLRAGLPDSIRLGLSHDPALYLRDRPLMTAYREAGTAEYILVAMRTDHESSPPKSGVLRTMQKVLPGSLAEHWGLASRRSYARRRMRRLARSLEGSGLPVRIKDIPRVCHDHFLEIVRGAKEVHTDRLHAMIVSIMLGKPVFAYETVDDKLEAVYEHSLRGRPGVDVRFVKHA